MVSGNGGCWMKKTLSYYFIFSVLLGSFIYFAQLVNVELPKIIRFYINDFLIVPIVLTICLFIVRKIKSDNDFEISLLNILYLSLLYSIIFEYWLPTIHPRYTSDFVDVGLYFLSGMGFYFLQKQTK